MGAGVVAGLLLAAAGALRVGPGIAAATAMPDVLMLDGGRASSVSDASLDASLADMRAAALGQPSSTPYQRDFGRLALLKAGRLERADQASEASDLYAEAEEAFRSALSRTPLASDARRGVILALERQHGMTEEVARLFHESLLLDAGDYAGTTFALRFGIQNWRRLPPEAQVAVGQAVAMLERSNGTREGLIRVYVSLAPSDRRILDALLTDAPRFDQQLRYLERHGHVGE